MLPRTRYLCCTGGVAYQSPDNGHPKPTPFRSRVGVKLSKIRVSNSATDTNTHSHAHLKVSASGTHTFADPVSDIPDVNMKAKLTEVRRFWRKKTGTFATPIALRFPKKTIAVFVKSIDGQFYVDTIAAVKFSVRLSDLGARVSKIWMTREGYLLWRFTRSMKAYENVRNIKTPITKKGGSYAFGKCRKWATSLKRKYFNWT